MQKFLVPSLVAAAALASSSSAAIIVFTNQFVWEGYAVGNDATLATETFSSYNGFYNNPLTGTLGGVAWSAAATGGLYVGAVGGSNALSTNNPTPMTISFGGSGVFGVSGNIYGTDINFNVVPSIIQLSLQDGTSYIAFIDSQTAFAGFYSTGAAISAITISAQPLPGGTNAVYPTFDNMSVAVPAPGAIALLGLAGLVGRRRR
jgi:MYXO-CTERM domain-containing protein